MTGRKKDLLAAPEAIEIHRQRQCLPDLIEPIYVARMIIFLPCDDAFMRSTNNYMIKGESI